MITTEYLDSLIEKDKAEGLFRCKREMFTSKELFELEMEHIFEGNWIYLAHESQLPKINDYYTTKIGRQPVFITRNKNNELNCFINACAHRGATLARFNRALEWNDMSRGAEHWIEGPDEEAGKIGLKPILSGVKTEDEGLYVAQHSYWLDEMRKAVAASATTN